MCAIKWCTRISCTDRKVVLCFILYFSWYSISFMSVTMCVLACSQIQIYQCMQLFTVWIFHAFSFLPLNCHWMKWTDLLQMYAYDLNPWALQCAIRYLHICSIWYLYNLTSKQYYVYVIVNIKYYWKYSI